MRQNLVYVSCYLSGQLAEVDVNNGELTSITQLGRGPFKIALNFGQDDPSAPSTHALTRTSATTNQPLVA